MKQNLALKKTNQNIDGNRGNLRRDETKKIIIEKNSITYLILNKDGVINKIHEKEAYPGMGMLTFSDREDLSVIERKLPELNTESENVFWNKNANFGVEDR